MKRNVLLCIALFILSPFALLAQQRQIKGTVSDESGTGIPEVTVSLKGTNTNP